METLPVEMSASPGKTRVTVLWSPVSGLKVTCEPIRTTLPGTERSAATCARSSSDNSSSAVSGSRSSADSARLESLAWSVFPIVIFGLRRLVGCILHLWVAEALLCPDGFELDGCGGSARRPRRLVFLVWPPPSARGQRKAEPGANRPRSDKPGNRAELSRRRTCSNPCSPAWGSQAAALTLDASHGGARRAAFRLLHT